MEKIEIRLSYGKLTFCMAKWKIVDGIVSRYKNLAGDCWIGYDRSKNLEGDCRFNC